ncbi:MAG TPA: hypothetical protein VHX37_02400 [Acidobacteriaceae bacterium]|nr:hypothetical protein [Acidobacteriaceae bacterium]
MKALSGWCSLVLVSALFAVPALGQEVGGLGTAHRGLNVFAEFSAARSGQGVGTLWGGSAGSFLQGRVLGFGLRATEVPSGDSIHLFDAVAGPRIAVGLPFVSVFLDTGGGVGHSGYYDQYGNYGSSWGPAWQADLGASHTFLPRLSWRILEVGYGRIYTGPGVSPLFVSTGLTLHVW